MGIIAGLVALAPILEFGLNLYAFRRQTEEDRRVEETRTRLYQEEQAESKRRFGVETGLAGQNLAQRRREQEQNLQMSDRELGLRTIGQLQSYDISQQNLGLSRQEAMQRRKEAAQNFKLNLERLGLDKEAMGLSKEKFTWEKGQAELNREELANQTKYNRIWDFTNNLTDQLNKSPNMRTSLINAWQARR